jgi:hypothetical protein
MNHNELIKILENHGIRYVSTDDGLYVESISIESGEIRSELINSSTIENIWHWLGY